MKTLLLFSFLLTSITFAADPPENSTVVVDDNFERSELGKGWAVQTGAWKIENGVLHAAEIPEDKHAAAARRVVETGNAVYELKFQFIEGAKGFHFGFDPKRGSLDKKGHLFTVIVTPEGWKLLKHLDKNSPKDDPNEILDSGEHPFTPGAWFTLRVTTWGTTVKAVIDGIAPLTGNHPSFSVPKPTLVFRAIGDGVMIDDLKVWVPAK